MALGYARIRQAFTTLPLNYLHMNAHYQTVRRHGNNKLQMLHRCQVSLLYTSSTNTNNLDKLLNNATVAQWMNVASQKGLNSNKLPLQFLGKPRACRTGNTVIGTGIVLPGQLTMSSRYERTLDDAQHFLSTFNKELTMESCVLMQTCTDKDLQHLYTTDANGEVTQKAKQPADEPAQKFKLLFEKLRNEIPMFMNKQHWHDFDDYTSNIKLHVTLKRSSFKLRGLWQYKRMVSMFRRISSWYLCEPNLELLSISESEEQNTIEARWRIVGWTPIAMMSTYVLKMPCNPKYYDFVSTFYVNENGKIWRHDVTKMRRMQEKIPIRTRIEALKNGRLNPAALVNRFTIYFTKSAKNISRSKQCAL